MRVALVGWDWDDAPAQALRELGCEVVGFTRWYAGFSERQEKDGWSLHRCPHRIIGDILSESETFRETVSQRAGSLEAEIPRFDVIHALDAMARPAALGLASFAGGGLTVASLGVDEDPDHPLIRDVRFDQWICDHPWTLHRWRDRDRRDQGPLHLIPGAALGSDSAPAIRPPLPRATLAVTAIPPNWSGDAAGLAQAFWHASQSQPLSVAVLGWNAAARVVADQMASYGLLSRMSRRANLSARDWNEAVARSALVAVVGPPSQDPLAWSAWLRGIPVACLDQPDARELRTELHGMLNLRNARERDVRLGGMLARRAIEPLAVAAGWAGVYADALHNGKDKDNGKDIDKDNFARTSSAQRQPGVAVHPRLRLTEPARSRLHLLAVNPRQLHASWSVHPEDLRTAATWMGSESMHAAMVIRILEITNLQFHGNNPRSHWDVELRDESGRQIIHLDHPGPTLAAVLGLRSERGYFHPLAHTEPIHLPKEGVSLQPPSRQLHALSRTTALGIARRFDH